MAHKPRGGPLGRPRLSDVRLDIGPRFLPIDPLVEALRSSDIHVVAERAGLSVSTLSKLVSGKRSVVTWTTVDVVCRALGLHPAQLYKTLW